MKARQTNTNSNVQVKRPDPIVVSSFKVSGVRTISNGTPFADVTINGVTVYGCAVKANKDGEAFLAWPSTKGHDGKYYKHAWAPLSQEDQDNIITEIYKVMDSNNG